MIITSIIFLFVRFDITLEAVTTSLLKGLNNFFPSASLNVHQIKNLSIHSEECSFGV
jgi:hypothetical protein